MGKDIIIVAELLVCVAHYSVATAMTVWNGDRARKIGQNVVNGFMAVNLLLMLYWIWIVIRSAL